MQENDLKERLAPIHKEHTESNLNTNINKLLNFIAYNVNCVDNGYELQRLLLKLSIISEAMQSLELSNIDLESFNGQLVLDDNKNLQFKFK